MYQDDGPLSRYLVLYQFIDMEAGPNCILHIQLAPGYGNWVDFELLQKETYKKTKEISFPEDKSLLSLTVEDPDILFIQATGNFGIVVAGGIWQVRWLNDEAYGGSNGYALCEIASEGFEMVQVETLLQDEEYTLFEEAVAHAEAFLKAQRDLYEISSMNGREVGVSAPERIHQERTLPVDIRAIEHSWLLVFRWFEEYQPKDTFSLVEVAYHFQDREWQFSARVLEERDDI